MSAPQNPYGSQPSRSYPGGYGPSGGQPGPEPGQPGFGQPSSGQPGPVYGPPGPVYGPPGPVYGPPGPGSPAGYGPAGPAAPGYGPPASGYQPSGQYPPPGFYQGPGQPGGPYGGPGQPYGQPPRRGGGSQTVLIVVVALVVVVGIVVAFLLLRPQRSSTGVPTSPTSTVSSASSSVPSPTPTTPTLSPLGKGVDIAHGVSLTIPKGWEVTKQDASAKELKIGYTADQRVFYAVWIDYTNASTAAADCQDIIDGFATSLTDVKDLSPLPAVDAPPSLDAASCAVSGTNPDNEAYDYYMASYVRSDGLAALVEYGVPAGEMTNALASQFFAFDREIIGQLPRATP